ncbi:glycerophosphoryl diester phosphodiesterase membrane domain-containing protein [Sphingomonas sp. Y38-1Y]|uniref:glycerophosphoryl diester phosphodiesterase membrane domain-containing protein n=1 Tax=Sphingomonas sp. Y38-1Y TaxID=3078265 RepID=UPI0028E62441|nr:glycerophosphoryl diester phosphodiesterase membrane domain-containing protein [Sphingomonas sp. Y38-1Y]
MVKMTRVWEATSDFLNEHGGAVAGITLALVFAPSLVSGLLEAAVTPGVVTPMTFVFQLLGFVLTIVSLVGTLALTALAIAPARRSEAVGQGVRRLLPFIAVMIVLLLAFLVLMIPFIGIAVAGGVDFSAASVQASLPALSGGTAAALAGYGLVLFAVLLWVGARLAVLAPVIVAERRGLGAIGRSWRLTRGHGWRIVGVFLLYLLVAGILSAAIGAAAGAIGAIAGGGQTGFNIGRVIPAVAMAGVSSLLTVVQSAFAAKLYVALAPASDLEETFA